MSFVIAVSLLFCFFMTQTYAFDADEHDAYLEQVLFGDDDFKNLHTKSISEKIQMLEYASYLAIDQCGGSGVNELNFLKEQKVKNIPKLNDFDLTGIFFGNHRNYTHRGWDYSYTIPKGEKHDKANWKVRRELLCSTVNKVFDFGLRNELFGKVCGQCNSFSALIYYVHILGDHIAMDSYKVNDLTIPLARAHAYEENPDVFGEIKKHCEVLFSSQKDSVTYLSFMQELDNLAIKARTLAATTGGISEENFEQYHSYSEDLMELLISYVPLLLENEKFFKTEFYSE